MTTRGAMKTEILDDMERSSPADGTRVLSAISSAIKFYQPRRFFFNESRSVTFSTAAGTDLYTFTTIGTEFYRIDSAFVTVASGDVRELDKTDYVDLEWRLGNDTTTTVPREFAYVDRSMRLWPSPDAIYTVRLTGHVKYAEPAGDDTVDNEWFTEAYELIRCRAKAYLYAHVYPTQENLQLASIMRVAERDALYSLMSATTDKVATGYLEATDF